MCSDEEDSQPSSGLRSLYIPTIVEILSFSKLILNRFNISNKISVSKTTVLYQWRRIDVDEVQSRCSLPPQYGWGSRGALKRVPGEIFIFLKNNHECNEMTSMSPGLPVPSPLFYAIVAYFKSETV